VIDHGYVRLTLGERVRLGGSVYRVERVNQCRARIRLIEGPGRREHIEVKDGEGKVVREFDATRYDDPRVLDVSPNSILERVP
jgi:hypothetical protein